MSLKFKRELKFTGGVLRMFSWLTLAARAQTLWPGYTSGD